MRQRAFTLVELLVCVGLIAVLMGMLLPCIGRAQKTARQVQAAAALRELMSAYTAYHTEHDGSLLWGYTPVTVNGVTIEVQDPHSGFVFGLPVSDRYPWRLVKYCGNLWSLLHQHAAVPPLPQAGDLPQQALIKAYNLSINPSFGINAIFLGGHAGFGGFGGANGDRPNVGKHVAFRASEIRRASGQIVFAECVARNAPFGDPDTGLHFLSPPNAAGKRWWVSRGTFQLSPGAIVGLPLGRYGTAAMPKTLAAFFDGHVSALSPEELSDMRLWYPKAKSQYDDFKP